MTADFSLTGGVALVTGAGSGIGRAIALGLASAGAFVGCVDRVPGNVEATAAEILAAGSRAVPIVADVTDLAAMSAAVARIEAALGLLTLGVNAAGIASAAPAESMPEEQSRHVIDVDLPGGSLSCQAEGQAMIRNGGGSIVDIASMSATIANRGLHQAHYNSAKAGVVHLGRSLAWGWGRFRRPREQHQRRLHLHPDDTATRATGRDGGIRQRHAPGQERPAAGHGGSRHLPAQSRGVIRDRRRPPRRWRPRHLVTIRRVASPRFPDPGR